MTMKGLTQSPAWLQAHSQYEAGVRWVQEGRVGLVAHFFADALGLRLIALGEAETEPASVGFGAAVSSRRLWRTHFHQPQSSGSSEAVFGEGQ